MLKVEGLNAGYGSVNILWDIGFEVKDGEIVAILGSNGAGKTTMVRTITGMVKASSGKVEFNGEDLSGKSSRVILDSGIVQVPEGRQLFTEMTVLENLELLADCGFLCEDFGDGTVLVREVPDDVRAEDAAATLEELAQKLRLHSADRAALRDEVLHTVACKSAIKAGMTSDPAELRALAAQVQSGAVRYCPHGRPVAVKLSEYEIEKMFKRA